MKFINSLRFAPVINEGDLPWSEDPLHLKPEECTSEFYNKGIMMLKEWWYKHEQRCRYGYTVPNAIDYGGDAIVDEKDCFGTIANNMIATLNILEYGFLKIPV